MIDERDWFGCWLEEEVATDRRKPRGHLRVTVLREMMLALALGISARELKARAKAQIRTHNVQCARRAQSGRPLRYPIHVAAFASLRVLVQLAQVLVGLADGSEEGEELDQRRIHQNGSRKTSAHLAQSL